MCELQVSERKENLSQVSIFRHVIVAPNYSMY